MGGVASGTRKGGWTSASTPTFAALPTLHSYTSNGGSPVTLGVGVGADAVLTQAAGNR